MEYSVNEEVYRSFQQTYYPQRLEVKYDTVNVEVMGSYPTKVFRGSTVEMTMDGQKFTELATTLYEIEADTIVRKNNTTVMKAYEQYKILLELART
jgi:hypothetical protein